MVKNTNNYLAVYSMTDANKKWLYFIILSVIWGSSFILIKKSLVGLTPYQVGALRIIFTAFFLFAIGLKSVREIRKKDWKWIGLSGFLGSFFPPFLFAIAQTEIDSGVASILNSLTPLHTFIVGALLFGILITKRQLLGMLIGLAGTVILISSGSEFNPTQNYWYSGLIIISSLGYGFNINIIKKHLLDISAVAITVGNFLWILLPSLVILYFTGFFETVLASETMQIALIYVSLLALFGTAIAKVLFNKLVQVASPVFAASVTYTMPLIAILWGLWDGEELSPYQFLGGTAILLGVYLANKSNGNKKAPRDGGAS